jgi:hypothetical protein
VQDQLGHSTIVLTADTYTKSRELHQAGEVCEVFPRTKGLNAAVAEYCGSFVTWDYSRMNPPDARSARQKGEATGGPLLRAHQGEEHLQRPSSVARAEHSEGSNNQLCRYPSCRKPPVPLRSAPPRCCSLPAIPSLPVAGPQPGGRASGISPRRHGTAGTGVTRREGLALTHSRSGVRDGHVGIVSPGTGGVRQAGRAGIGFLLAWRQAASSVAVGPASGLGPAGGMLAQMSHEICA